MKPRHPRGQCSLKRIYGQCTFRENGCKIWRGQLNPGGYPVLYDPTLRPSGRKSGMTTARAVVWRLKHGERPEGAKIVMTCNDRLCLAHDHMLCTTQAEVNRLAAKAGAFSTLRAKVAQCANARNSAKLSIAKARDIRQRLGSGEQRTVLAVEFGVTPETIRDVEIGLRWQERAVPNSSIFNLAAAA